MSAPTLEERLRRHEVKTCTKCGIVKTLSGFSRNKLSWGGLRSQCKACACEYSRAWHAANPKEHRVTKTARHAADRGRVLEALRARRALREGAS